MVNTKDWKERKNILVKVKPNASKTKIISWDDKILTVSIASPPKDNKANLELLKFLKKITKKKVILKHGTTSRLKTVTLLLIQ